VILMRWSKVRSLVEGRWPKAVKARLSIQSTAYGNCSCGRAWFTLDGLEIANFCTRAVGNLRAGREPSAGSLERFASMPVGYGELSRQDAYQACWAYLHDLPLQAALTDPDPLVQSLAVLDARLGRRRLATLDAELLHPLARRLLEVRLESEAIERRA
jgi:hypothetical protein